MVREGNVEMLERGRIEFGGLRRGTFIASMAAEAGQLAVLQYLCEHGCPWNARTCSMAAVGGHMDVLRYAYDSGCPWNEATCYMAAQGGHLDVLKYARDRG